MELLQQIMPNWVQIGSDLGGQSEGDRFGDQVAISKDGLVVAATSVHHSPTGHIRIFRQSNGNWSQIGDINKSTPTFGDLALSANGNIIAFGEASSNSVRVYQNNNGSWSQLGSTIYGEASGDYFGIEISLSDDGDVLAVGAIYNDGNGADSGSVRIYRLNNQSWVQIGNEINGESANDLFGYSVDLSSDGDTVVIGASGVGSTGQVQVWRNVEDSWEKIGNNINGVGTGASDFGKSVAISDDGTIIAAGSSADAVAVTMSGYDQ